MGIQHLVAYLSHSWFLPTSGWSCCPISIKSIHHLRSLLFIKAELLHFKELSSAKIGLNFHTSGEVFLNFDGVGDVFPFIKSFLFIWRLSTDFSSHQKGFTITSTLDSGLLLCHSFMRRSHPISDQLPGKLTGQGLPHLGFPVGTVNLFRMYMFSQLPLSARYSLYWPMEGWKAESTCWK